MIPNEVFERAKAYCGKLIDISHLDNPKRIQEKLCWLRLHDNNKLKTICADKIGLHDYAKWVLGKDICNPILQVYNSPDEIDIDKLPEKFALKCNHGSGYNVICTDKSTFDLQDAKQKLKTWLSQNYGARSRELQYYEIKPKCFVETFIPNHNDYKIWCFNGNPGLIEITTNKDTENETINYYDMEFNFVDICRLDHGGNSPLNLDAPPSKFNEMKDIAKKLSFPFKFVRVDLYESDDTVLLGELTFLPSNAKMKYKNPNDDYFIGSMLEL